MIFYNISEITAKGKVKGKKQISKKKEEKAATQEAVTQVKNQSKIPDNMTSEEAAQKESKNMTMNIYIEQILKPHFVSALKKLAADSECEERVLLKKDNDKAHDTYSVKNKVQAYKKKKEIETYVNFFCLFRPLYHRDCLTSSKAGSQEAQL